MAGGQPQDSTPALLADLCVSLHGREQLDMDELVTCMRNFSKKRGAVAGILKGYVGLTPAIFTDICSALFASDPSSFLLMLTFVPGIVCVTSMLFLHPIPSESDEREQKGETQNFSLLNVIAIVLAIYLLAFDMSGLHGPALSRVFTGFLLLLLAAPLIVPAKILIQDYYSTGASSTPGKSKWTDIEKQITEPLLKNIKEAEPSEPSDPSGPSKDRANQAPESSSNADLAPRKPRIGEDHTIFEAMQKFDFWLLFLTFLCGVGKGMAVINNLGQIEQAMGYADVSVFVSLINIWGFFGRIASGSISEHFIRKAGVPRPVWMAASQVLMIVGYITMAVGMQGSLYIGSVLVGICYGVRLSVSVPTASELFGLKYYGLLYNILILNLPIGSFLFSGLLAGILYDIEAGKAEKVSAKGLSLQDLGNGKTCVGAHCYRLVFLVMAAVCLLGFGLDVLLTFRVRNLYKNIYKSQKAAESPQLNTENQRGPLLC